MGILLLVIGAVLFFGGIWISNKFEEAAELLVIGAVVVCFVSGLTILLHGGRVVQGRTYERKIEMYQQENKHIEGQVEAVVAQYMKHEDATFDTAKTESSMTLVTLFPELKSDSLVKEQIKIFNENNKKIKELKEQQIDISTSKWWLYFGG